MLLTLGKLYKLRNEKLTFYKKETWNSPRLGYGGVKKFSHGDAFVYLGSRPSVGLEHRHHFFLGPDSKIYDLILFKDSLGQAFYDINSR